MVQLYRRFGGETLVNTTTLANQSGSNIAMLPGGGFIVVWTDGSMTGGDTSGFAIRAQRYDEFWEKTGSEFLVNTTTSGNQTGATVATLPSGRFVVTWTDASATGGDTSNNAVRAQIFEANGTPVGGEFLVNTETAGSQASPAVAELTGGGFVIVWGDSSGVGDDTSGSGVKAQIFNAAGSPVGTEFLVNTTTAGSQGSSGVNIIGLPSGGFAVTYGTVGSNAGTIVCSVFLQLFDAGGAKVGSEQILNADPLGNLNSVNITALNSGYIVTWAQQDSPQGPGIPVTHDLHAQRLDANGVKVGPDFVVNTTTAGSQTGADVDRLPGGGFIVTWQGPGASGTDTDIFGQFFDDNGERVGGEVLINTITGGNQTGVKVDVTEFGDIIVTWTDGSATGSDPSGSGIKMQVLARTSLPPTDIAISNTDLNEVAIENLSVAALSATSLGINSHPTYTIISDSSGGAFRIDGDQLVVDNSSLLDFETRPNVEVRIRATDINGAVYEETLTLSIADAVTETRYAAGGEFVTNTATPDFSGPAGSAALVSGGFVVVTSWLDLGNMSTSGFRAQIFDEGGNKVGPERDIIVETGGGADMVVTGLASGGFLVAYRGGSVNGPNGNFFPIQAQIFDPGGNAVGSPFMVSTTNEGIMSDTSVATLDSGGFVVTWSLPRHEDGSDGGPFPSQVRGRIFDMNGQPVGDDFRVNTGIEGAQTHSHVAALSDGGFIVTWAEELNQQAALEGQRFDAAGNKVGGELAIAGGFGSLVTDLAALSGGGFVATWTELTAEDDINTISIKAQIVDGDGVKVGGAISVATVFSAGTTPLLHVAGTADGGFVVTWESLTPNSQSDDDSDNFARFFDAAGLPIGDAFMVGESDGTRNEAAFAVRLASGDLAFSWYHSFVTDHESHSQSVGRVFAMSDSVPPIGPTEGPDTLHGTPDADTIDGLGGNDVVNGHGGDDALTGGHGDDELRGGADNDTLFELDGANDQLFGEDGNDRLTYQAGPGSFTLLLDGGAGDDLLDARISFNDVATLNGGTGRDRIIVNSGQEVTIDAGADEDLVQIQVFGTAYDIALGAGADLLVLTGEPFPSGVVTISDFSAGDAGDAINFADYLVAYFGTGTDPFANGQLQMFQDGANTILQIDPDGNLGVFQFETAIVFENVAMGSLTAHNLGGYNPDGSPAPVLSLSGSSTQDFLTGNSGNDAIAGNGGNDVLYGASGNDSLQGGGGDDELFGQLGNDNLNGGVGVDAMAGGIGNDILDGGTGADRLDGGFGNDWFYVDNAGDVVIEAAGQGSDRIIASLSYTLAAGVEVELMSTTVHTGTAAINLTGNELANTIYANDGANVLDGKAGVDTLVGRLGDDWYYVDNAADRVLESAGEGNDRVVTGASWVLGAGVSVESLVTVSGTATNPINLTGNALAQSIVGNAGINSLDSGGGGDIMVGLGGNDVYFVRTAGDRAVEATGGGSDRVFAAVSFALEAGSSVETLNCISGTATTPINLTGNAFAQSIVGNAGANRLDSGGGGDIMVGLGGDDFYFIRGAGDRVVEATGGGSDRIFSALSFTLEAGSAVEVLGTSNNAGTAEISLTGNELANTILGNAGANMLDGKGGADTLFGSAGADSFAFTTAPGGGNVDRIIDFNGADDTIRLENAVFTALGAPGALGAGAFHTGAAAGDADDRIVYNSATGQLFYDADGNGAGAAILFASLDGAPVLGAADFLVI